MSTETFLLGADEVRSRLAAGDGMLPLGEMLASLLADPVERSVVDALAADLVRDGGFREPVIVLVDDNVERIADGRHRVAAHLQTDVFPLWVRHGYPPPDTASSLIRVTYRLFGAGVAGMPLRSFPVGEGWAVADVAAVVSVDPPIVSYSYWATGLTPEQVTAAGGVAARALGFDVEILAAAIESPWE